MKIQLGGLLVGLESNNKEIQTRWQSLFHPDQRVTAGRPDIILVANLAAPPPRSQEVSPVYTSENENGLRVYQPDPTVIWLRLPDRVEIEIDFKQNLARLFLSPSAVNSGRLEDLTAIALAPLLRRRQYYLIHGFTAVKDGRAVLFIGRSGSGKTTSGLATIGAGWRYFGNDIALVAMRAGKIIAHPAFGALNVHPHTLALLPQFGGWGEEYPLDERDGKVHVPAGRLPLLVNLQAAVKLLAFPEIVRSGKSALEPLPEGIALARLMEDSVDHWDVESLAAHFAFLRQLIAQATAGRLVVGADLERVPFLLEERLDGSGR